MITALAVRALWGCDQPTALAVEAQSIYTRVHKLLQGFQLGVQVSWENDV